MDLTEWLQNCSRVSVRELASTLPTSHGVYAFFVDVPESLPEPCSSMLASRANPHLVYVGNASGSLRVRVWEQDCQHKRPASFFRSVGVVLGYISPLGGKNFEFAEADKASVKAWILEHLTAAWTNDLDSRTVRDQETILIRQTCPLLNWTHNPQRIQLLWDLRCRSRRGARYCMG